MRLFSLDHTNTLATLVAERLAIEIAPVEVRQFADGEYKVRPLVDVIGSDVVVINSLFTEPNRSVHDKLCLLLFFAGALKDAMANSITLVSPYLCYTRKDRRTKARDPLTLRYVAQSLEAAGIDRVVSIDVHNVSAFESAFRIPTEHLEAQDLLRAHLIERISNDPVLILSPDLGAIKRAEQFRKALVAEKSELDATVGFVEKERSEGVVTSGSIFGDPEDRIVIIVDDLISSGQTVANAARSCKENGAKSVLIAATHGVFTKGAETHLISGAIHNICVTNTVVTDAPAILRDKISVIDCSKIIAKSIEAIHQRKSIATSHL